MSGFSIYCSFGKKGFGYDKDDKAVYIRLGFLTICYTKADIEDILKDLLFELEEKDKKEQDLLKREKDLKIHNDLFNDKKEKMDNKIRKFKDTIEELNVDLKEISSKEEENKRYIDKLEDEVADLEEVNDENVELQKEVDKLEKDLQKERFSIKYLKTYFNIY